MSFVNEPIPAAAAEAGMTDLVFFDDFDSLDTIDIQGTHRPGYKWYTKAYGHVLDADHICQQESYIRLGGPQPSSYGLVSYSHEGDFGYTARCGCYMECRMRAPMPIGEYGGIPAFWTMGVRDFMGRPYTRIGELDVVELFITKNQQGEDQKYFAGSVHDHWRVPQEDGSIKRLYGSNTVNATGYRDQFPFTDDEWHTYGALWEKGHIAWYMDGKLMHSVRYAEGKMPQYFYRDDPTPLPSAQEVWPERHLKFLDWQGSNCVMDRDEEVVFLTSRETYPMDVDWVRIWRK